MTHTEMDDLYELYVLGALEPELAAEIERHLVEQCSYCLEHVREASQLTAVMAGIAEQEKPPAHLRERVLATVAPQPSERVVPMAAPEPRRRPVSWMFAVAALSAACIALAVYSLGARSELQRTGSQLSSAVSERDQARSALETANSTERAQVAALTSERDQLRSALAIANSTAQAQVAALTGERNRLRVALAAATGAASAASAQMATLTGERDQLRSALANASDTARAQVAALTGERDQLRSALANANSAARTEVAGLTGEVTELRSALDVMRRPGTRSIPFGTPAAPHGLVFANRNGGLVFVGSRLPAVASDRTLELWLVPKTGAPQPVGLFRPSDAAGDTIHISSVAVDPSQIKAVAVSDEPRAGSTAPTTTPFLLVPVS